MAVHAACLGANRQQDGTMWVILSESQDNRKKAFCDRWTTGVQEWEKVKMGDSKPFTLTGRECAISPGAKPSSSAKARLRQMRGAACGSPVGILRHKMRLWRKNPLIISDSVSSSETEADG